MTTDTDERVDVDVDLALQPVTHEICCLEDKFICGAQFHPELIDAEGGACEKCEEITDQMICHNLPGVPHLHCPLAARVCPTFNTGLIVIPLR